MSTLGTGDLGDLSMLDLFRMEVETQSTILTEGLLGLERHGDPNRLEELMRAAHSLKGAARIVGRQTAVRLAHAMEDCFVAAQEGKHLIPGELIDALLMGTDLLNEIARIPEESFERWEAAQKQNITGLLGSLSSLGLAEFVKSSTRENPAIPVEQPPQFSKPHPPDLTCEPPTPTANLSKVASDRVLQITANNLDCLMGLAGEALVASRWLDGFRADLLRLKRLHVQISQAVDRMSDLFPRDPSGERVSGQFAELRERTTSCQHALAERLVDLELFDRRFVNFATRLYHEVLDCRMRPFSDGMKGFGRMVRDVSRTLGKSVRFEISGESTPVDRDILEGLKAPLGHLLRNAIDHGIEAPSDRRALGKHEEGTIQLKACHSAGMLLITVEDDGHGVDLRAVQKSVVERGLTTAETAQQMGDAELTEFLFLPGFSMKNSVSEISGRGVGLDAVRATVKELGGRVRIASRTGSGTRFQLELPLTLSLIRTLLVEIAGDPYAFPLTRVERALELPRERIESVQGRQHFALGKSQIGLVSGHQVMELGDRPPSDGDISVVVMGDESGQYGLVIDRFLGERELVVRPLDPRLGKVKNISSGALMPDGSPVLIVDVDDLIRGIDNLISGSGLSRIDRHADKRSERPRKTILVIDDSLTVRELERKILSRDGYTVDVAVDGRDGWNAVRTGRYDLVVTDVDMPRMDGIDLLKLIRQDHRLKSLPVIIVSYKDRPEDRSRGMEAGADYYLTKASFHDETLQRVVVDLVGKADT